ncbi:MAG: YihY/virulence factor BrkB family protein [Thermodesulfobacteria bacterium]|nr:YihY/virulence factor BrkB family protein [Thermodesulfobacteriota bacterium]
MFRKFHQWLWSDDPAEKNNKWKFALKLCLRIASIVISGFRKHELELRASALTYMVILSLVPVLAMGTALMKGLGADNYMKQAAYRMIEEMEELSNQKMHSMPSDPDGNATVVIERSASARHLKLALDKIFDYVDRTNFAALGWLGILISLITVIALMTHIEDAMNTIWETQESRDIGRKIIDYIALIVLMPLSINVAFWAITANQSKAILEKLTSFLKISWIVPIIFKFLPFFMLIGTFTILYHFMPNTWVRWRAAALGGLIGGAGWILAQTLYIKLQIGVARYNAIYGSFATLPLFIFWVYIGWIIFLLGAETSYAIQNYKRLRPVNRSLSPVEQLALAIDMMLLAYRLFDEGRPLTGEKAADELAYPFPLVDKVMKKLVRAGLLIRTEKHEEYLPGISMNRLRNKKIFEALCGTIKLPQTIGGKAALEFYNEAIDKMEEIFKKRACAEKTG